MRGKGNYIIGLQGEIRITPAYAGKRNKLKGGE